jgi:hypothetical protein
MSLATLARKTRTKKRMNTRGKFILNMTGRGNVLGMNAKMSRGNCGGKLTNCAGKRSACCVKVGGESKCCQFPHGGKPAPQMGYGVYLNRKSKGAYHPGGGPQCCTKPNATSGKIVWKQGSNLDASVVIANKKDKVLACNSDVYTAKRDTCVPDCSGQCCCPVKKNICGCRATDLVRYTRINNSFGCQTTKAVRMGRSASEQIARNRAKVDCIKPIHRTIHMTNSVGNILSFDGCCGNQCLVPGQQYTFNVTNSSTEANNITIIWCAEITDTFTAISGFTSVSFTVPKFNKNCLAPTHAKISDGASSLLQLDYCKEAFKKPQMRSCRKN